MKDTIIAALVAQIEALKLEVSTLKGSESNGSTLLMPDRSNGIGNYFGKHHAFIVASRANGMSIAGINRAIWAVRTNPPRYSDEHAQYAGLYAYIKMTNI